VAALTNIVTKGTCATTPGAPLSATLDSFGDTVEWTAPLFQDDGFTPLDDLDGFIIEQSLDGGFSYSVVATVDAGTLSYSDASMPNLTKVVYRIYAVDQCGNKGAFKESNGVTKGADPSRYTFDTGALGTWTASGFWHVTSACGANPPFSAYYGIEPACNYDDGVPTGNEGYLTSPLITVGALNRLTFDYLLDGECGVGVVCFWDKLIVEVEKGGLPVYTEDLPDTGVSPSSRSIDLGASGVFPGDSIQIIFHFVATDDLGNTTLGAMVDNIDVD
jgi:hypothetical protein